MGQFSTQSIIDAVADAISRPKRATLHEPELKGREIEYLTRCIESGWVSYLGEYVERFERELANATGTRHAVVVVNGTVATHAALLVAGVLPGEEVLVPALTFAATANAVSHAGAVPHLVESEFATLGIDPAKLEAYLERAVVMEHGVARNRETGRLIRAVVPVHIFGHPVRIRDLIRVASRFGLVVVEDAAEALGSLQDDRPVGGDGLLGILSFNGNKIVTTGGGGAIITNNEALARRAKHITTTAKKPHPYLFDHDEVGYNYRMPNINAAVGCAQLEQLPGFLKRKRKLANAYAESLSSIEGVSFFSEPNGARSNYWLNALLLEEERASSRDALLEAFMAQGLHCRPAWTLMHKLPMYAQCPRMDLATSESIAARLINLPSSPSLIEG